MLFKRLRKLYLWTSRTSFNNRKSQTAPSAYFIYPLSFNLNTILLKRPPAGKERGKLTVLYCNIRAYIAQYN